MFTKTRSKAVLTLAAVIVVMNVASLTQAAVVSLSFEELAADGSNVLADGTLHTSFTAGAGGADAHLINTVDFNSGLGNFSIAKPLGGGIIANRNSASTYYGTAGDGATKDTTDNISYGDTLVVSLTGLTIGNDYRIQLISFDGQNFVSGGNLDAQAREQTISASSTGDSGTLDFAQFIDGANTDIQNYRAALVFGTWTATATSIDFDVTVNGNNDNAILNAFAVHDITSTGTTIPTPAALPAGLALIGLAAMRRRRS